MKKIILEMYLKQNLGDDIFLYMLARRYPDVEFYTRASKKFIKNLGLENVRPRSVWRKIFGKKYIAKVVMGGSMFMENGLAKKDLIETLDSKYGDATPLFFIGENFGPYQNEFYLQCYRKVFEKSEDVCFRDKYSAQLFSDLPNIRVEPDVVFGLGKNDYICKEEKKIVVSVIDLESRDSLRKYRKIYEDKILEIVEYFSDMDYEVVLMSFCETEGDENAIRRILNKTKLGDKVSAYFYKGDINEAIKEISSAEYVIGTRFHSVILGLLFNKKLLPIVYSDKTGNVLNDINYTGKCLKFDDLVNLDVLKLKTYFTKFGDTSELNIEAQKHFEKLDRFLKNGGDNV